MTALQEMIERRERAGHFRATSGRGALTRPSLGRGALTRSSLGRGALTGATLECVQLTGARLVRGALVGAAPKRVRRVVTAPDHAKLRRGARLDKGTAQSPPSCANAIGHRWRRENIQALDSQLPSVQVGLLHV